MKDEQTPVEMITDIVIGDDELIRLKSEGDDKPFVLYLQDSDGNIIGFPFSNRHALRMITFLSAHLTQRKNNRRVI